MSVAGAPPGSEPSTYSEVHASPEFAALRRSFRTIIFPATAVFLAWYFLFVLLSVYAPDFMSTRAIGNISVGVLLGLGQFVTTFAITMGYRRWADRDLDAQAAELQERIEGPRP